RMIEKNRIDLLQVDELDYLDRAAPFRRHRRQLLVGYGEVLVGSYFVAPDGLFRRHRPVVFRADHLPPEGGVILVVEEMETDAAGGNGLDQPHRDRHQTETYCSAPHPLYGH